MSIIDEEKQLLPHHEQLQLCTTRLPYRQGRKLTAVKVYTINDESAHLLIFGVPSLNLRREAKDLFSKFGRLIKFNVVENYAVEEFTETYHAFYDRIQSARIAKKMLDTNSFYGGSLHVCYAPELETIEESKNKLLQRKKDVMFRLRNIQKETVKSKNEGNLNINKNNEVNMSINTQIETDLNINTETSISVFEDNEIINEIKADGVTLNDSNKLNMGESNVIYLNTNKNKRKKKQDVIEKRFKSYMKDSAKSSNSLEESTKNNTDIVDCTSVEKEVVSNINEALNYKTFGNEVIKKVIEKPLNKIVFNFNKKS